jgi:poly(3-hydroxybutyrate) depolymerase
MHATQRILASSLVLTLACTSTPSTGEVPEQHALRWNTLTQDRQPPLRYTLVTPEGFDPTATWPVLVALPPGSQAPDMVERCLELYFTAEARSRGWVVVSPAAPEGQNFVQGAEERLPALLDAIAQEIRIEGGGFHLAGVSTGGRSAIRLAGLHPERFLSLSVLPGAASNPQDEERLVGLTTLPVTLYVGELDERWRETTYRLVEQLTALGAKDVLLQEQAGEEHVLSSTVATLLFDRLDSLRPTPAQAATTPEQRFFDWTQLQFPAEVHAARRARLADALRAEDNHQGTGQAVFLSASSEGFSQGETFRQTDDFLYLTGLELPRSILALDVASGETTLFAPTRDARFENRGRPNDFPGRPLAADPALADVSGLEWVRPATELEGALVKWIEEGRPILLHGLARPTVVSRFKAGHSTPGPFARRDEAEALEAYLRTSFPTALLHDASSAVALDAS